MPILFNLKTKKMKIKEIKIKKAEAKIESPEVATESEDLRPKRKRHSSPNTTLAELSAKRVNRILNNNNHNNKSERYNFHYY